MKILPIARFLKHIEGSNKDNYRIQKCVALNRFFRGTLELIDECYFQVLIEAIDAGNPHRLKLKKSRVCVDTGSYLPEDDDAMGAFDTSAWFTIKEMISDMWKAYKWEPYKTKVKMLFKSLDYTPDETSFFEIRKHIVLRNCMHHHESILDRDSLKSLGRNTLSILEGDTARDIEMLKPIIITKEELQSFSNTMKFAQQFNTYVAKRISTCHLKSRNPTKTCTTTK